MTESFQVKIETFQRLERGWGVRICFLYEDRAPEIFEKDSFPTELVAHTWGNDMVMDAIKSLPEGTTITAARTQQ